MRRPVVIAVDGTAASGKGTLAKKLAHHFGFAHLDSGSLYRLTALAVFEAGGDPSNAKDAERGAHAIDLSKAGDPKIRTAEMGTAASNVATFPAVREALLHFQREFLRHPPGESRGAVMDGRDIGTVICPDATAKLFIDAKPEVRAHRRWLELEGLDEGGEEGRILAELKARDLADKTRAVSPLKPASDAFLLDTSDLDIDAAFAAALALVKPKVEEALKVQPKG
jgi:cytidylate kinase